MKLRRYLALCVLATTGCGGGDGAPSPAPSGELVFTVNRDGFGEIWTMREDGSDRRRITPSAPEATDASGHREPAWSPDGSRIAFVGTSETTRESENDVELYTVSADGSELRRLTENDALDSSPAWSPDGERIAVARTADWGTERARAAIYLVDADDGDERLVFADEGRAGPSWVAGLTWSPDGSQIAFGLVSAAGSTLVSTLYVVSADGGEARALVEDATEPAWSPDGRSIAVTSGRDRFGETCFHDCSPSGEIYVVDAGGSGLRRLTRSQATDSSPAWSPDGTRIVFASDRSNRTAHQYELWVVDAAGGAPRRLTRNDVWDLDPDWR